MPRHLQQLKTPVIYAILIHLYGQAIKILSYFNWKAALWYKGRVNWESSLEMNLSRRTSEQIVVWFHCASLGEFELAVPVMQVMKDKMGEKLFLLVTFFSPSGFEQRKNHTLPDAINYLPLDTRKNAVSFLDKVNPTMAVMVKYEFWLHLLHESVARAVPIAVIGVRFEEKSSYFRHLKSWYLPLFKTISVWSAQDEKSMHILKSQGMSHISQDGDARIDRTLDIAQSTYEFPTIREWRQGRKVLILGSVWDNDLHIISKDIIELLPHYKVIVAPHDVGEVQVQSIEKQFPGQCLRYSYLPNIDNADDYPILIIDNIGMLAKLYRYGYMAYVGGAFGSGLHNIFEPLAHGIPVIFGPKTGRFPEADWVKNAGIGVSIQSQGDLNLAVKFLEKEIENNELEQRILQFMEVSKGASHKIAARLIEKL